MKEIIEYLNEVAQPQDEDCERWYIKGGYCNGLSIEREGETFWVIESSEYSEDVEVHEVKTLEELKKIVDIF